MRTLTTTAWKKAVKKWEAVVAALSNTSNTEDDVSTALNMECPYCKIFFRESEDNECASCPLKRRRLCNNDGWPSPYCDYAYWVVVKSKDWNERLAAAKRILASIKRDDPSKK